MHVLTSLSVLGSRIESRDTLLQHFLPENQPPVTFWKEGEENPRALEAIRQYRHTVPPGTHSLSDDLLQERLFLPMVDEAVRCLHERIVEQPWQIDFALTYGIGFPAFRGGLLTWARQTITPSQLVQQLEALTAKYGKRFEPCPGLADGGW
jgi:hypothetical protein